MRFLKSNQAKPGAVDAFTEAVKFAIHVVGISCQGEPSKIFSPWSIGFRGLMQCKKRERVPAKVLQVDQVKHIESLLDEPDVDIKDRYACGAFLFCIFSRSRISDIRDVFGFLVDTVEVGGELKGFIECRARSHKTAKQASVQGVAMPLVAPVNGVSALPWGPKFVRVAETAGLPLTSCRRGPLLPMPLEHEGWGSRAISSRMAASAFKLGQ